VGGKIAASQVVDAVNALSIFGPRQAGAYREHADRVREVLGPDIETKIRSFVAGWALRAEPGVLILTGNAGTGKTALVEAFCEQFGSSRPEQDALVEVKPDVFVVKDFSGLKKAERGSVIKLAREIDEGRVAQLLVCANEGVIRDALGDTPDAQLESQLDRALESGASNLGDGRGAIVVNMNRQRWTGAEVWGRLLDYMVRDELWESCEECDASGACPIKANAEAMRRPGPREAARRLVQLAAGGSVSTLRELLSILSHGVTGGLTCEDVVTSKTPYDATTAYFNLILGEGLSRERIERSTLLQEICAAELGAISDIEVDGWLRDPSSAPAAVTALGAGDRADLEPHGEVRTRIGLMSFAHFGETISISDDAHKVEACMADYVEGRKVLELWRRRVFFEAAGSLGGWKRGFTRLTSQTYFGDLIDVASTLRADGDTASARRSLILGLNYLVAGFAKFGGYLVVPDPGSLAARNPGSYRRPAPSIVHSQIRVEHVALQVEDGVELVGILDSDDVRVVLQATATSGESAHLVVTPRLFEIVMRSGRFKAPAGADIPEMNDVASFYGLLSRGNVAAPLEVVDPAFGVIRPVTLPTL
jgi:hypothetical protein